MKLKLLTLAFLFSIVTQAQITKAETFLTGTKVSFYPNQCGNAIPEAAGKLTFCDGIDNLGVVERSYGLNDRRVERMLSNHYNEDEIYVTSKGLSIRNVDGTWENIPNIAIPTYSTQGDWTNIATIQNGLVLPNGKIIIQSSNVNFAFDVYDRTLKEFSRVQLPNNISPKLFTYDADRNLTWIITFNSSNRQLYVFDGTTTTVVDALPALQGASVQANSATLIYKDDYLYFGSNNGLHKIDVSNYMSPPLTVNSYDTNTTPNIPFDTVNDLQFDTNGDLWLAQNQSSSDGGLVKFNVANETYDLYQFPREDNNSLNHAFQNIALDENNNIWAGATYISGVVKFTFDVNDVPIWDIITHSDLETLGVPMTYNPNNIYFRNNQFYFTTSDGSSGSNNNFEVVISDNDVWSGRNDNEEGNLSERMNRRFTNNLPDANGGVWWFNAYDDIVVYRDSDDNHQSILIENIGYKSAAVDNDDKAIVRGGLPGEIRKIDFPNANSIQEATNQANDMKRVSGQVWIFDRGNKKIDAYRDDALVNTYNLDEDWYLNAFYFAVDDNGDAWFIRSINGIEIKKFDTTTLTTTTYDVSSIGSLSTLRKVVTAPNGGIWFIGTLGAVYQENGVFYPFLNADYSELYYLVDIVVDTNGKAYLLNNDSASITTIENPTDANPILTNTSIENENTVLPSLDHYRPDALTIDSEGSIWTHASLNTFKLVDDDFATEYIAEPTLSTSSVELVSEISVYPNPTEGIININSKFQIDRVDVYSVLGKKVAEFSNTTQLDLSQLTPGLYLLKIVSEGRITNKKIVVR